MDELKIMIWFFPIIFIFHDFEEIIFIQSWMRKNLRYLRERFPWISQRLFTHFENITTSSFALGVAEEFVLIIIITVISFISKRYILWTGMFIAFSLHLLVHCFQALIIKRYVPAIFTSVVCMPVCIYIIHNVIHLFPYSHIVIYTIISFIIIVVNLIIVHKCMDLFSKWLTEYEKL